ncbi:MAG: 1-acyl-sn-glycerol-3-phosphate acyltransferase [Candidatus Margulisbacteria bacterium]|jgi:1-acyl-sn-glycerol-3-phosphate acyltransferase|nr:1-acyl-sn-glycerol-3-phosphate acyltransferase [Candidatus Margulisiibacteriota bacterium]
MIIIRLLHTLVLYLYTIASFFVGSLVALCCAPFSRNKPRLFQTAAHLWARTITLLSGIRVKVTGLNNIPQGQPLIIVANHQGAADIPVLLACLPVCFRFAIKKELFGLPIFGWYLRQAGYFPIDRALILSAYKMVERIIAILKTGESVMIFPEGTRSRDGSLGEFKRGSLMAALKAGVPILPVAIDGSYNILPRGTWLIRPTTVTLGIGKPIVIRSEEEYDAKVKEVRDAIAAMLPKRP